MKRSTKLRMFGGVVLLFNLWLIGRYDLAGTAVLLLTFGFAIGYELLVVRLAIAGNNFGNVSPASLKEPEAPRVTAVQEKIGIVLQADDGRTILNISQGSPAQKAGIVVGDQLFVVNNELCGIDGKVNALKIAEAPGASVQLGVWRDGAARIFTVTRAEA